MIASRKCFHYTVACEGVNGEGHDVFAVHHFAEGVRWVCLKGYLSFPAFFLVGLWPARKRVVPSIPTHPHPHPIPN